MDRQQREGDGGAGERLGGDDGDLGPRVHVDAAATFPSDRATDDVDDAEHLPTLALDLLYRSESLEGFARLADRDIQRVTLDDRVAIAEFGGGLGMRRQPCQLLDQLGADAAGKMGGAAAEDLDAPYVEQLMRGKLNSAEMARLKARLDAPAQGATHRLRLLDDLLAHVVRELALIERI